HGADAVYIGAARFGARADAGNSVEDIRQLVEYAHLYEVKVYVTLNTIIFEKELDDARRLIEQLNEAGTDALIVQDMAVPFLLSHKKKNTPVTDKVSPLGKVISLHASTQMDNRTAEKVAWLRDLGFEQVVLARELTLNEIQEIHQQVPDVKLEVFVHGAICVSYNGQCYASQHCFGRSANRGQCAQFCRMPFDLIDKDGNVVQRQKHLLSLRDMNRSSDLEALLDTGVSSLKIEGRLKDPTYVKNVVAYYRQKLDEIFQRRPEFCRSSLGHATFTFAPDPVKSFNRGFTDYFLHGRTTDMANIHTPKNMGEPVGYAQSKNEKERWISITRSTHSPLHNGDGLCFLNNEGQLIGFRVNRTDGN
ncbi:MAG: U32 family peptidase, partial [Bacteroidaceae bacterium]|nr:U32 family peptidase [Bacteroidaceae bacterium]